MSRMKIRAIVRECAGFAALGVVGLAGCSHSGVPGATPPGSAMAPSAASEAPRVSSQAPEVAGQAPVAAVPEVHVNQDCLILQDNLDGVRGMSVPGGQMLPGGGESDPVVCHLESKLTSNHVQSTVVNGIVQQSVVVVQQQQYLLQNQFSQPVVFVVEHAVPDGWRVNSFPLPSAIIGKTAIFKVVVQPGQVAGLHVSEQHLIPLAPPAGG